MKDRFCSCGTRADIRQLTTGFPKKLLVAISVVVFIAMCLRPSEAASLERRAMPHHKMPNATKDIRVSRTDAPLRAHRRRHQLTSVTQTKEHGNTKRSADRSKLDVYESLRMKIENKIAYIKNNFDSARVDLMKEVTGDYGSGMPTWLHKINFVRIHFHKFGTHYKNKTMRSKKIFEFYVKNLYKALDKYYTLFMRFIEVQVSNPDNEIIKYNLKRHEMFNMTANNLNSAMEDMRDAMNAVKTQIPKIKHDKRKLKVIELLVDGAKYLKNDDILLRAYGNLLENWYLEFNCSKFRTHKSKKVLPYQCRQFHRSLIEKRDKRKTMPRQNASG